LFSKETNNEEKKCQTKENANTQRKNFDLDKKIQNLLVVVVIEVCSDLR